MFLLPMELLHNGGGDDDDDGAQHEKKMKKKKKKRKVFSFQNHSRDIRHFISFHFSFHFFCHKTFSVHKKTTQK
tara:strand:+ start:2980 stop:3201 length:222 start_codon:yes stop_codon:yes gene_type:complete